MHWAGGQWPLRSLSGQASPSQALSLINNCTKLYYCEIAAMASFILTSNHFLPHNFQHEEKLNGCREVYFLFIQNIFRSQLKNTHWLMYKYTLTMYYRNVLFFALAMGKYGRVNFSLHQSITPSRQWIAWGGCIEIVNSSLHLLKFYWGLKRRFILLRPSTNGSMWLKAGWTSTLMNEWNIKPWEFFILMTRQYDWLSHFVHSEN